MSVFVIAWMWVVGIPTAYYAISKAGTTTLPAWFTLVLAHLWPITIPVLAVVGITIKS